MVFTTPRHAAISTASSTNAPAGIAAIGNGGVFTSCTPYSAPAPRISRRPPTMQMVSAKPSAVMTPLENAVETRSFCGRS